MKKHSFGLVPAVALCLPLLGLAVSAFAQTRSTEHTSHHAQAAPAAASSTDAEVRKIDKEQAKVTLKHGRIESLDMPPMTMVFKVSDPKLLDQVKPGDKVKVAVESINGVLTVTAMHVVE